MKSYKQMISKGLLAFVFGASATVACAQFSVGTDFVSSYVWRGCKQDLTHTPQSPNIQPYVSYGIGGLTLGVWGSTSLTGTVKEVDLYATYAFSNTLALTLTDYNWSFTNSYFKYGSGTDHIFEATLAYAGTESLPLSASLNTMFAGNDKTTSGKQAFSTYVELGYSLADNAKLFAGGLLNDSQTYGIGAGLINAGLKVTKSLEITEKCCLPIYGIAGVNPVAKDAFIVLGVTL
ncbi:MAG TPA: hypothetical protein VFP20_08035 [Bacteroidales bacterium]|nr:hypothetical protein [Bacteroidales bacterium]